MLVRMEQCGSPNRIHISADTVEQLKAAGKEHWCTPRENRVAAKGKGELQTFWLEIASKGGGSSSGYSGTSGTSDDSDAIAHDTTGEKKQSKATSVHDLASSKTRRLIEWNVDILAKLLKQIIARRLAIGRDAFGPGFSSEQRLARKGGMPIHEVVEVIRMPKFDRRLAEAEHPENIFLPRVIMEQLHDYVSNIAALYNDNPFHCFEHASHGKWLNSVRRGGLL